MGSGVNCEIANYHPAISQGRGDGTIVSSYENALDSHRVYLSHLFDNSHGVKNCPSILIGGLHKILTKS